MNLTSSHPFWAVNNGLVESYPSLHRNLRCDAVVVGGGITGALVGMHLSKAGIKTILIDKRDIGTGSTSASTGLLQYEIDVPLRDLIPRVGRPAAMRSYQLCQEAIGKLQKLAAHSKIDCGFERKPSLFLARHRSEIPAFAEEFRLRQQAGMELQLLDAHAIRQLFPFSRPAALFSRDGAQVDPHRLTHGLLKTARNQGLQIYDRTEMKRLEETKAGVRLTTQHGVQIVARRAIIAAGYESKLILKRDAGDLKSTYALISEPLSTTPGWYRQSLIWESGSPYLYLRTTEEGRVIVGGEDEDFVNGQRRDACLARKTRVLTAKYSRLFPHLPIEVAFSWAGTFAQTKDGLAFIGVHSRFPHLYFALGYGGNGITFSLIAAEVIRDLFLGRKNSDATLFRFGR